MKKAKCFTNLILHIIRTLLDYFPLVKRIFFFANDLKIMCLVGVESHQTIFLKLMMPVRECILCSYVINSKIQNGIDVSEIKLFLSLLILLVWQCVPKVETQDL